VIADFNGAAATAATAEINARYGADTAMAVTMDVTNEAQVDGGVDAVAAHFGCLDVMVCNAGNQIIESVDQFEYSKWKLLLAVYLDGAFLATRAALRHMYKLGNGGSLIYMGSIHSKEASQLKAPYVSAKHGLIGLAKTVAEEGAKRGVRANVVCPGFVRTPLVAKQIPEQAKNLDISEEEVIKNVMLRETVDGEFTTVQDVASLAGFERNADRAVACRQPWRSHAIAVRHTPHCHTAPRLPARGSFGGIR
jgi:3-hydroxybutyrate dehydrogenase